MQYVEEPTDVVSIRTRHRCRVMRASLATHPHLMWFQSAPGIAAG